jgi:hypothetical protein
VGEGKNEWRRRCLNPNACEGSALTPRGGHSARRGWEGGDNLLLCEREARERQGEERVLERLL